MKIEFIPSCKEAELSAHPPKPAKLYIPEYYKKIKPTDGLWITHEDMENNSLGGVKKCMPFLDSFTSGYIQETWTEIYIKKEENNHVSYSFPSQPMILAMRRPSFEIPNIYYPYEFAWQIHWMPKLPKGWSAMFTSPLNRFDLPFRSFTGIVDSDGFYGMSINGKGGNYPFYVNKDFEGVIPVGTPMYQIIPFKREDWKSVISKYDEEGAISRHMKIRKYFTGGYKKEYWQKKIYE